MKNVKHLGAVAAAAGLAVLGAAAPAQATFSGTNGQLAFTSAATAPNTTSEIFAVNPDGSGRTQLTSTTDANESAPAYSPDGERIVYARASVGGMSPPSSVWVMNADGSGQTPLAEGDATISFTEPSFSPDGTKIAFTGADGGATNVFTMNADGSDQQPITATGLPQLVASPVYSPDGTKIAATVRLAGSSGAPTRIGIMNADGTGLQNLSPGAPAFDGSPDWSPDGSKIAFQRDFSLFEMSADGSGLLRLTQSLGLSDFSPVYSPQGSQFAFARSSGAGDIRIGSSGVENGPTTPVTTTSGSGIPSVAWQAVNPPACRLGTVKPAKSAKKITVQASCSNEDATLTIEGSGKAPKSKPFAIPAIRAEIPAGGSATVQVKLPKKPAKAIKKATKAGKKAKVSLSVSFADGLGASTGENVKVKFKPKKKRGK